MAISVHKWTKNNNRPSCSSLSANIVRELPGFILNEFISVLPNVQTEERSSKRSFRNSCGFNYTILIDFFIFNLALDKHCAKMKNEY